jgi:hypothetical protein
VREAALNARLSTVAREESSGRSCGGCGTYAAAKPAPDPGHEAAVAASGAAVYGFLARLVGYGSDAVHGACAVRTAVHGFVSLEAAGRFGMPENIDDSVVRLVDLVRPRAQLTWTTFDIRPLSTQNPPHGGGLAAFLPSLPGGASRAPQCERTDLLRNLSAA